MDIEDNDGEDESEEQRQQYACRSATLLAEKKNQEQDKQTLVAQEVKSKMGSPYLTDFEIVRSFQLREASLNVNGKTPIDLNRIHSTTTPRQIVQMELADRKKCPMVFVRPAADLRTRHVIAAEDLIYDPMDKRVPFPDELLAEAIDF